MSVDGKQKPPRNDTKRIAAEAARWHAVMRNDADVADNLDAFTDWLEADERHFAAFTRLCTMHAAPSQPAGSALVRLAGLFRARPVQVASAMLAASLVVAPVLWPSADLTVPVGTWQERIQNDGSLLRFGPGSRADLVFTKEQRLVKLDSGSVVVEAAKDPNRPLIVETPHGSVRVVGTRFTVIVDPSSTELTVSRGEVRATAANAPDAALSVRPSQRVHISKEAVIRDPSPIPDAEEAYGGWRTLNRVPLADLVAAVERETGLKVVVLPTQGTRAILASGRFHVRDAEATLSLLADAYGLRRTNAPFGVVFLH